MILVFDLGGPLLLGPGTRKGRDVATAWRYPGFRRAFRIITVAWGVGYLAEADWPIRIAPDARIDSTARFSGFYSIGAGCQIGAETTIEDTILWPGAQIASRAYLRNCIVRSQRKAEGELSDTDI